MAVSGFYCRLNQRGVLTVDGDDARSFLQGVISNDVTRLTPQQALWAAFLTAQGKYLHDFFLTQHGQTMWLDCEAERRDDLRKRLSLYRLRAKVTIDDASDTLAVFAVFGEGGLDALALPATAGAARTLVGGVAHVDPRLAEAGARVVLPDDGATEVLENLGLVAAPAADYDGLRLSLGLPDGSRDMVPDRALLLENGFDELHGVDWHKGCYLGQELTARTKYRALIKKRLMPVTIDGPEPSPGAIVMAGDREAGEMRSANGSRGLALLRLERIASEIPLTVGDARLTPHKPDWAVFAAEANSES